MTFGEFNIDVRQEPKPISNDLHYIYAFTAEHGVLDASFTPNPGNFCIANLNVDQDYRRQGIAKALVHSAIKEAEKLDAHTIYARLISRESIDVMIDVFGKDAVTIRNEGSYTEPDSPDSYNANATLWYELK